MATQAVTETKVSFTYRNIGEPQFYKTRVMSYDHFVVYWDHETVEIIGYGPCAARYSGPIFVSYPMTEEARLAERLNLEAPPTLDEITKEEV